MTGRRDRDGQPKQHTPQVDWPPQVHRMGQHVQVEKKAKQTNNKNMFEQFFSDRFEVFHNIGHSNCLDRKFDKFKSNIRKIIICNFKQY